MTISFIRRRTIIWTILAFFIGVAVVATLGGAANQAYAQDGGQGEPTGKAYRGATLFSQRCVQCHGEQGQGDGPLAEQIPGKLPDFTAADYAATMSPQDIFDVITQGRMDKMMPPWGNQLSDDERWDLTAYVWSLHLPAGAMDESIKLYEQDCSSCHGSSGAGMDANTPDLSNPKWLDATDAQIIAAFTTEPHPDTGPLDQQSQALLASAARRFSLGFDQTQVSVEGLGDVEVLLQNGSSGEHLANHPVRLIIFEKEQFVETREGETDAQGRAQFTGLPTAPTWAYVAESSYQDLTYHSEVGQFSPDSNMIELSVSVYDPGASKDAVSIDRAHWLVDISNPTFVDIGEVYSFLNTADKVYTGDAAADQGQPRVLEMPLPANAIHISVEGETLGERFILDGTTLIDTQPLPPGNTQIFLRYSLPVADGRVTLSHQILYPMKMLNLLAPDVGITVEAPHWQQGDPIQSQTGAFLNYSIFDLPAGSTPVAILSGINEDVIAAPPADEPQQVIDHGAAPGISGIPYLPWWVGGLALLVLGGGVAVGWRKHKQALAAEPELRQEQKQRLIQQMATLDDAFEAGEIAADAYHKERNTLKLKLIALLREEQDDGGVDTALTNISETPKIHPEENAGDEEHGEAID